MKCPQCHRFFEGLRALERQHDGIHRTKAKASRLVVEAFAGRGELAELVADHLARDVDGDVLHAIMDEQL